MEKNLVVGTKKFPNLGLTASVHLYHIFHWMSLDFATNYLLVMTVWRPWKARYLSSLKVDGFCVVPLFQVRVRRVQECGLQLGITEAVTGS